MTQGIAPASRQAHGAQSIPEEPIPVGTSQKSDPPRRSVTFEAGLLSPPQGRPTRIRKPRGTSEWQQTAGAGSNGSHASYASHASNTSHSSKASHDAQTDVLLRRLRDTAKTFDNVKYSNHSDVAPTATNPGCIEKTLVKVALNNHGKKREYCLDANTIDISDDGERQLSTRYFAGRSPASGNTYLDGFTSTTPGVTMEHMDMERYLEFDKVLVQAIESKQGLYQFVWPKTHQDDIRRMTTLQAHPNGKKNQREISVYEKVNTAFNEMKRQGNMLFIDGRYHVTNIKILNGRNIAPGLDYFHYQISIIDRDGNKFTIPMTQAGLPLTEGRLAEDQIARAHAILQSHRTLLPQNPDKSKPAPEPMIMSNKGRIRNATLIAFTSVSKRIDSGLLATTEQVDDALHDAIAAGYDARGTKKFIPSPTQIAMLRAALMQRLASRLASASDQARNDFAQEPEQSANETSTASIPATDVPSAVSEPVQVAEHAANNDAPREVPANLDDDRVQNNSSAQPRKAVENSPREQEKVAIDIASASIPSDDPANSQPNPSPASSTDRGQQENSPSVEQPKVVSNLPDAPRVMPTERVAGVVKSDQLRSGIASAQETSADVGVQELTHGAVETAPAEDQRLDGSPLNRDRSGGDSAVAPLDIAGASPGEANRSSTTDAVPSENTSSAAISDLQPAVDEPVDPSAQPSSSTGDNPVEKNIHVNTTAEQKSDTSVNDAKPIDKSSGKLIATSRHKQTKSLRETFGFRPAWVRFFQEDAFQLRDNARDGNCLFHALGGTRTRPRLPKRAEDLRNQIADYVMTQTFSEKECRNFYMMVANTFQRRRADFEKFLTESRAAEAKAASDNDTSTDGANQSVRETTKNLLEQLNQNYMLSKGQYAYFLKKPNQFAGDEEVQFWLDMDCNKGKTVVIIDSDVENEKIVWFAHREERRFVHASAIAGKVAEEISDALRLALFEENVTKSEHPQHLAIYRSVNHFQRIVQFRSMKPPAAQNKQGKTTHENVENEEPVIPKRWRLWSRSAQT